MAVFYSVIKQLNQHKYYLASENTKTTYNQVFISWTFAKHVFEDQLHKLAS